MDKKQILDMIRRMAEADRGKSPGSQRFESETGVKKNDWYPKYWLRWGDAVREAGCESNLFSTSYDPEVLIRKYIDLIRELKNFPIEGQLMVKRKGDKTFPDRAAFKRLGSKSQRAARVLEYCRTHEGFEDVVPFCAQVVTFGPLDVGEESTEGHSSGYVYLVRHGARREYKIGRTNNPIRREGEISIALPEQLEPVHRIKTDDPAGVERYWHVRFAEKRKNGEWFALSTEDVRAFKRWKRIY